MKTVVWPWYLSITAIILVQAVLWFNFGTTDMFAFIKFANTLDEFGLKVGYSVYNLYYPPLASVIIYPITIWTNYRTLPINQQLWLIKAVEAIFYYSFVIVSIIWYRFQTRADAAVIAKKLFFILANIALIESSMILGYFDIFLALPLFGAFYFMHKKRFFWSGVCLAISFMIKLIPIFLLPAFIIYFSTLQQRIIIIEWKKILAFLVGVISIVIPLVWYFTYDQVHYIIYISSFHGDYLSFSFNLPRLIAIWKNSNITSDLVHDLSRASFYLITALVLTQLWYGRKTIINLIYASIGILFTYGILFTGVHENHLVPVVILALLLWLLEPRPATRFIYYALTILVFFNLFLPYGLGYNKLLPNIVIAYLSLFGIVLFICFLFIYFRLPSSAERLWKMWQ